MTLPRSMLLATLLLLPQVARANDEATVCVRTRTDSLAGVTLKIVSEAGEVTRVTTGDTGCANVPDLPAGTYRVKIDTSGYHSLDEAWVIPATGPVTETFLLTPAEKADEVITVEGQEEKTTETRRSLDPDTIMSLPGTSGDALKALQNLPGLARTGFISGGLLVRGAAPEDSQVLLDGQAIPQLYHFGGLTSVIATDMIESIDFLPGGFGVRYGRALGGVVAVDSRSTVSDGVHGSADVDLYDTSVVGHARLGNMGTFSAAGRRSYVDFVLNAALSGNEGLSFTVAPRYYDYQARYQAPYGAAGATWNVFAYGTDDALTFVIEQPPPGAEEARGRFSQHVQFHRLQGGYTRPLTGNWSLNLWPGVGVQRLVGQVGSFGDFEATRTDLTVRAEASGPLMRNLSLLAGLETIYEPLQYRVDVEFDDEKYKAADRYERGTLAAYVEANWQVLPELTLIGGARTDAFFPNSEASIDPRMSVRYQPSQRWFGKAYVGLYHQPPQPQDWDPGVGNPELRIERAVHAGFGGGTFLLGMNVEAEVFWKYLDRLITEIPPDPANPSAESSLSNERQGRAYGAEILIRKDMTERLFGWLAYTLSRSERLDPYVPGGWFPFGYDQTHILTAVASYRLGRGWEAGVRFRWVTGNPDTKFDDAIFDADSGNYIPIPGAVNGSRLPAFNQLDVRFAKKWEFRRWSLEMYLDVQNVYNRANPEVRTYDYDYENDYFVTGLPIFPSIGVRGDF